MMGEEKNGERKLTLNCHSPDVAYVIFAHRLSLKISHMSQMQLVGEGWEM